MLHAVAVNVVVGPNWLLKLVANDHARTLGWGTTGKEHDTGSRIGKRRLVCIN